MKQIFKLIFSAIVVLVSTITLGLLPATLISLFISSTTDILFKDCVISSPFWIIVFFSIFCSTIYINDIYKNHYK